MQRKEKQFTPARRSCDGRAAAARAPPARGRERPKARETFASPHPGSPAHHDGPRADQAFARPENLHPTFHFAADLPSQLAPGANGRGSPDCRRGPGSMSAIRTSASPWASRSSPASSSNSSAARAGAGRTGSERRRSRATPARRHRGDRAGAAREFRPPHADAPPKARQTPASLSLKSQTQEEAPMAGGATARSQRPGSLSFSLPILPPSSRREPAVAEVLASRVCRSRRRRSRQSARPGRRDPPRPARATRAPRGRFRSRTQARPRMRGRHPPRSP
jgi:hypothetical protein